MAKPEWGTKRICQSCDSPYYDLRRDTPACPKCGTTFSVRPAARQRKPVPKEEVDKVAVAPKKVAAVDESDAVDDPDTKADDDEAADNLDDEDDDALIEDTSDLGENDDDVSEVKEHLDDEDMSDRG